MCFKLGRASATPTLDLFITMLSLGSRGYKNMLAERKEIYGYLKQELSRCAEGHGERILQTPHNPISIGNPCTGSS